MNESLIDRENLVNEFRRLVEIDSESYHEREMADYLLARLKGLGLTAEEDDAWKILQEKPALSTASCSASDTSFGKGQAGAPGTFFEKSTNGAPGTFFEKSPGGTPGTSFEKGQAGAPSTFFEKSPNGTAAGNIYAFLEGSLPDGIHAAPVLFAAHMDTVSPGNGKHAVLQADGRITSDGTTVLGADDAAALSAILTALEIIQREHLPHPPIEILFPAAEEPYTQGSRLFDFSKIKSHMAYVLDLSGPVGNAALAAPSILSFKIKVLGRAAHAGFCPETGIHAIDLAAKALVRVPSGRLDKETTLNVGLISGGTAPNIVPDACVLTGEIRSMQHERALEEMSAVRTVFENEAKKGGGKAEVFVSEEFRSYRISENEEVVRRFEEACRRSGIEPALTRTFGGSDNNTLASHGIRGIVLACGMNDSHTVLEWTSVDELYKSTQILLNLMSLPQHANPT